LVARGAAARAARGNDLERIINHIASARVDDAREPNFRARMTAFGLTSSDIGNAGRPLLNDPKPPPPEQPQAWGLAPGPPTSGYSPRPFQLISSRAWKLEPSALIWDAWPLRACVLSAASGGTEME